VRQLLRAALDLLYPSACYGCGTPTAIPDFCTTCRAVIHMPTVPLCVICGAPFRTAAGTDHPCGRCLTHRPHFRQARACAIYDGTDAVVHPLKSALHRYKYVREVGLARPLGALLAERCPFAAETYDVIMPVPLHLARLRWRGFNQSQHLAHTLARRAGVPVDPLSLQRIRATHPQVRLAESERHRNVARAFSVLRPDRVRRRRILLVDDVYTTGATVDECSRVLLRAGARQVDVLVLARAVLH
jgi:ComF family protein